MQTTDAIRTTEAKAEVHQENTDRTGVIIGAVNDFHAQFKCQRCGKCCTEGQGVALWAHEFFRLLKIRKDLYKHITFLNNWRLLKMPCVFYNARRHKCDIHKQKPYACRLYPLGVLMDGTMRISPDCTAIKENPKEVLNTIVEKERAGITA